MPTHHLRIVSIVAGVLTTKQRVHVYTFTTWLSKPFHSISFQHVQIRFQSDMHHCLHFRSCFGIPSHVFCFLLRLLLFRRTVLYECTYLLNTRYEQTHSFIDMAQLCEWVPLLVNPIRAQKYSHLLLLPFSRSLYSENLNFKFISYLFINFLKYLQRKSKHLPLFVYQAFIIRTNTHQYEKESCLYISSLVLFVWVSFFAKILNTFKIIQYLPILICLTKC